MGLNVKENENPYLPLCGSGSEIDSPLAILSLIIPITKYKY